ncbi:MAG: methyl-accepting chemotaxis protein [Spongiibacteraceae bacterium]
MKLSTITNLSTSAFVLLLALLASTLFYGIADIEKPIQLNNQFGAISYKLQVQLVNSVNRYLQTGDANLLTETEHILQQSQQQTEQMASNSKASLLDLIKQFNTYTQLELRAAGKLSGDPFVLLAQNERETVYAIADLRDYVIQARATDNLNHTQYWPLLTQMMETVAARSQLRTRLLQSKSNEVAEQINLNIEAMTELITAMKRLPTLGVFTEVEANEFDLSGLGSDTVTEKREAIISDLASLNRRYLNELKHTQEQLQAVNNSRQRNSELTEQIQTALHKIQLEIIQLQEAALMHLQLLIAGLLAITAATVFLNDFIQRSVSRSISKLSPYLQSFSDGNFSKKIDINVRGKELKELISHSNQVRQYILDLVERIRSQSGQLQLANTNLSTANGEIDQASKEQAEQTEHIRDAITEMTESFSMVAGSACNAAEAANFANQSAQQTRNMIEDTLKRIQQLFNDVSNITHSMESLDHKAQQIGSVVSVISNIASQTNLLALNAAIESARAGEHGRGFAVVADQVRQLSQNTSSSAEEINQTVGSLQAEVSAIVSTMQAQAKCMHNTREEISRGISELEQLSHAIERILNTNDQIASTTEEQTTVINNIHKNVLIISEHSQHTLSTVHKHQAINSELEQANDGLLLEISKFRTA